MIDQDGKLIARPQPDPISALAELAPKWAKWFCVDRNGIGWAQSHRGEPGFYWNYSEKWQTLPRNSEAVFPENDMFAINLKTGAVHLAQPDGTVIEVSRGEWDL